MKKLLAAVAAASVLAAGAFVASTVASNPVNAQTTETQTQEAPERPDRGEALDEALGGLVTDGVARLMHVEKNQEARYGLYKAHHIYSEEAEHAFIRCLELGVLGRSPRLAWEDWKNREDWGKHPTAWRFMNNVTAGWNSQPTQPTMFAKSRKLLAVLDGTTRFTPLPPPEVGAEVEATEVVLREVA